MLYTYIEIISHATDKWDRRLDVTGETERQIDRIDSGLNINLNHDQYYTRTEHYETPQPLEIDRRTDFVAA